MDTEQFLFDKLNDIDGLSAVNDVNVRAKVPYVVCTRIGGNKHDVLGGPRLWDQNEFWRLDVRAADASARGSILRQITEKLAEGQDSRLVEISAATYEGLEGEEAESVDAGRSVSQANVVYRSIFTVTMESF